MPYLIIETNSGKPSHYPKGEKEPPWEDKAQADARCEKANADAAALGIKARYEVKEA